MLFKYFMVGKPYANSKPGDQGFPALEVNAMPHTHEPVWSRSLPVQLILLRPWCGSSSRFSSPKRCQGFVKMIPVPFKGGEESLPAKDLFNDSSQRIFTEHFLTVKG